MRPTNTYHLALGSNIGDTLGYLEKARNMIGQYAGQIVKESSILTTEPEGFMSRQLFSNQVIEVLSPLSPLEMLYETQRIEKSLGRARKSHDGIHYDRTIDIDIILCGGYICNLPDLKVPHPEFRKRQFVLHPLAEIAPNVVDPVTGMTIKDLAIHGTTGCS